jgi:hypothetical protein
VSIHGWDRAAAEGDPLLQRIGDALAKEGIVNPWAISTELRAVVLAAEDLGIRAGVRRLQLADVADVAAALVFEEIVRAGRDSAGG